MVVIPSVYEAPSAVAMEAGVAGKPVVAFAVGGIPEVVRDGETGYLLPRWGRRRACGKDHAVAPQSSGGRYNGRERKEIRPGKLFGGKIRGKLCATL